MKTCSDEHQGIVIAMGHVTRQRADGQAPAAELGEICEVRRQLGEQQRIHRWLHGWLLIHVPLSWALLVLVLIHAFWSLYY